MKSPPLFTRNGSLSTLMLCALLLLHSSAPGRAQSLCVEMITAKGRVRSLPASSDATLRLRFRHSIYGSQVDEVFSLLPAGFRLTQLRYGEARLVEFYGHENARLEDGQWVVTPAPILLPSLHLHLSRDAAMSVNLENAGKIQHLKIEPANQHRLEVASCDRSAHD